MKRTLYLGLVDIIFAFAYDHRTTLGESNVCQTKLIDLSNSGIVKS